MTLKITRKMLKELYPLADEDYLIPMVEGKIHVVNYINAQKKAIRKEFTKYQARINNMYTEYLNSQERDYFLPDDNHMIPYWKKQTRKILKEYTQWTKKAYGVSVAEVYNYKRLYNLWMLSEVQKNPEDDYDKPVIGESDIGFGITDPGFTIKKLMALINRVIYGRTFSERVDDAYEVCLSSVDAAVVGTVGSRGRELNDYLKTIGDRMDVALLNKISTATNMGLEDVEDISDHDVFTANPFYSNEFQRVEILDDKTCLVCGSMDKAVYKTRLGRIHPNCRGVDVPLSDDEKDEAIVQARKANRRKNFDNWFNGLSEANKRSLLGKTKYDLYKGGRINVHDLIKQNRVVGAKEVKQIEKYKSIPSMSNDMRTARSVIRSEHSKLPTKAIIAIDSDEDIRAYYRYLDKKEAIYKNLDASVLKREGIHRNTLNAEVNRERKLLRNKEKQLRLDAAIKKKS